MFLKHILSVVLILICIRISSCIRCYECTSANNSMCLDPTVYDEETVVKYLGTTDCNQGVYDVGNKDFFCRKIVQTIFHKGHEAEVRVTRGCGWVRHRRECYKADNDDHLETVCQCFSDACNTGTHIQYSTLIVFGIATARLCF